MTEIPEDVKELAKDYVRQNFESLEPWSMTIARAILAERERCCSVLRRLHEQQDGETFDSTFIDIEEIIRKGA